MSDFLTPIIKGFTDVLLPLRRNFSSAEAFEVFLVRYGWMADLSDSDMTVVNGILIVEPLVESVVTKLDVLQNGVGNDKAVAVLDLIEELKSTIDQLSKLSAPGGSAPFPLDQPEFWTDLTENLFSDLFASYIETHVPVLYALFHFSGVIDYQKIVPANPKRIGYTKTVFDIGKLGDFISAPQKLLTTRFGWNSTTADFDHAGFLRVLERILFVFDIPAATHLPRNVLATKYLDTAQVAPQGIHELEIPVIDGVSPQDNTYWKLGGVLLPIPDPAPSSGKPRGLLFSPLLQGDLSTKIFFSKDISLTFDGAFNADSDIFIKLYPDKSSMDSNLTDTIINASATLLGNPDQPWILIGSADSHRLQVGGFKVSLAIQGEIGNPEIVLSIGTGTVDTNKNPKISLIFQPKDGDGFITKIVGTNPIEIDFESNLIWSSVNGVTFEGQVAFEIAIPLHLTLGPIEITTLFLALKAGNEGGKASVKADLGAGITANLGPLVCVVDNIGVTVSLVPVTPPGKGILGNNDLQFGFKPPNGVGLVVDTGVLKGGGYLYFDFDKGEYFGALELEFQDLFSLKAVGIIDTKMPDGSSGFSLLIIITADFVPIQLGFGFTLNGVGGLLGLNRTTMVDVLREGVKTNSIKSVLFPEDVVANIDRIVSDLKQIFPPFEGHFIVGPMAELGWADILTIEIGILIEIPDPRIIILGVLAALVPTADLPLLKIQVNFLGVIDFDNKYISFDASLYDSYLLIYVLTGDMAFRLSWGDNAFFLLSVGGFNPAFKDAPADLQNMARLGISLLNNDNVKISATSYFAVTSNTVQFGANVELYAGSGSFNVYGYLGFDVLFQFDPFHFVVDIYAGLALRRQTSIIMGITVSGELSGPKPWDVKGDASISLLFFSISVSFHETWGDDDSSGDPPKVDILSLLNAAISDNRNWKADIPDNNSQHVSIKQLTVPTDKLVIHPFGILSFSESIVPLDIDITKFGNALPQDVNHFSISATDVSIATTMAQDKFSPANFFTLTDQEKLSRSSFEKMDSGFHITGLSQLQTANMISKDVDYRLTYLRKKKFIRIFAGIYKFEKSKFHANLKAGAISKSALSYANKRPSSNAPDPVRVKGLQYAVANSSDLKLYSADTTAASYTEAVDKYNKLVTANPALKDSIQIVYEYELNSN